MTVEQQLRALVQQALGFDDDTVSRFTDAQILELTRRLFARVTGPTVGLARDL